MRVSSIEVVLEDLRAALVSSMRTRGLLVPPEADLAGNCREALLAWNRLNHRAIPMAPRAVIESRHLAERSLHEGTRKALAVVADEARMGEELSTRLTRQFFKAGFNDFLFNNFGIQHLHLGAPGQGSDKTKRHPMAGGTPQLLFVLVDDAEIHFIDVLDHSVFSSVEKTKSLIEVVNRERPELLDGMVAPGVVGADQSFEEAYQLAKGGFMTVYELNGRFFMTGGTVLDGAYRNGKRAPCTSTTVVDVTNRSLNRIVELVQRLQNHGDDLLSANGADIGYSHATLDLEVVELGAVVWLRDRLSGLEFFHDGRTMGIRRGLGQGSGEGGQMGH